jgi:hypothetical protein
MTVLRTYPSLRLGNYLYFALHAFIEQRAGREYRVLDSGLGREWRTCFPGLEPLLIAPREVPARTRYDDIPPLFFQEFGVDYSRDQKDALVRDVLAPGPIRPVALAQPATTTPRTLVLNIRRGDYYAHEGFRHLYGFDVEAYTHEVLRRASALADLDAVEIVSDDVPWCRDVVERLRGDAQWSVSGHDDRDPVRDFTMVSQSNLIGLTNSTFSYWAAYMSAVHAGRDSVTVWAPDFHSRGVRDGRPWQHDPAWHVIDVAPID